MRKRIWINRANSFEEAEAFDRNYYAQMTPEERLDIVQELREMHQKLTDKNLKGTRRHESRERLRRVIKVIQ